MVRPLGTDLPDVLDYQPFHPGGGHPLLLRVPRGLQAPDALRVRADV